MLILNKANIISGLRVYVKESGALQVWGKEVRVTADLGLPHGLIRDKIGLDERPTPEHQAVRSSTTARPGPPTTPG